MKRTTLILDKKNFIELKKFAASNQRTLTEIVNEFLRMGLDHFKNRKKNITKMTLPSYAMGLPKINISDRDQLEVIMEEKDQ